MCIRDRHRSSGTSTEEVEPDEELSKVLDESERSKIKLGADSIDSICVFTAISVSYTHLRDSLCLQASCNHDIPSVRP